MDDELTPEQKFNLESAETMVPRALLAGRAVKDVIDDLVRLDCSPAAVRAFVERTLDDLQRVYGSPESRERLAAEARKQVLGGTIMMILGAGLILLDGLIGAMEIRVTIPITWIGIGLLIGGIFVFRHGQTRMKLLKQGKAHVEKAINTDGHGPA